MDVALGPLFMGLLGGLAIFLFGLEQMTDALKSVAGPGMTRVLEKLTHNRLAAALTGAAVTSVIQSSSVTTVLVVGFVSAGIMSLPQSIGVIMGANIGTTLTAQIFAFKVTNYALAIVAIGFTTMFLSKGKQWKMYGSMLLGLGFIFAGMGLMSDATEPLRTHQPFIDLMARMDNPLLAILIAATFTALVQSSSATTGIVIVLAGQGFITLEAGIALAFGSNIGTCVTAVLAAFGKPAEAKQAAAVHLLFNVTGVLVWLPLIGVLASIVQSISPTSPQLDGVERLAAETPRQIANAHTLFNVANTLLFIWFTGPLATLVTKLLPRKPEVIPEAARPKFLQEIYLQTPALALASIRRETIRLGEHVIRHAEDARPVVLSGNANQLDAIVKESRTHQRLYDTINEYVRHLAGKSLTPAESRQLAALIAIAGYVQSVGETVAVNFVAIGRQRIEGRIVFGEASIEYIDALGMQAYKAFGVALHSLRDPNRAREVIAMKPEIQRLVSEAFEHLGRRLVSHEPNRTLAFRLETQSVEVLRREYFFAKKIAKAVIQESEASIEDPVLQDELAAAGASPGT